MTNQQVQKELSQLYAIVEAGEKGFATAAANVHNRGLKILLKSYAQQRANDKNQILAELLALNKNFRPSSSIPGMIHRGRAAIYAAMTIQVEDREMTILKEAVVGERVAVRTYAKALEKELPAETRQIVERQYAEIRKVSEQVNLMRGQDGKRMVVRLFDAENDADRAVEVLGQNGFPKDAVEKIAFNKATDLYPGKGASAFETMLSGAFGGGLWSILIGLLASFGMTQTSISEMLGITSTPAIWILVTLAVILLGAVVGGFLGYLIGMGISEDDSYHYQKSASRGEFIVQALVDEGRFHEAGRIMDQFHTSSGEPAWGASPQA